jgi:hypothetical protein
VQVNNERRRQVLHEPRTREVTAHLHQVHGEHLHRIDTLRPQSVVEISEQSVAIVHLLDTADRIRKLQDAMRQRTMLQRQRRKEVVR